MSRKFTIGREKGCDVLIGDESVSRIHAEIWLENGTVMIADRGSSNGTRVLRDGSWIPLNFDAVQPADQVRFGSVALSVKDLIDSVELKDPGALSSRAGPPPPPPVPKAAPPPPPPPRPGAMLVRCECGAIKTVGQTCPGCHR